MLVKFEQNFIVQNTRNSELFDKKKVFITIFDEELTSFWKTFLLLNFLFNAKQLI